MDFYFQFLVLCPWLNYLAFKILYYLFFAVFQFFALYPLSARFRFIVFRWLVHKCRFGAFTSFLGPCSFLFGGFPFFRKPPPPPRHLPSPDDKYSNKSKKFLLKPPFALFISLSLSLAFTLYRRPEANPHESFFDTFRRIQNGEVVLFKMVE